MLEVMYQDVPTEITMERKRQYAELVLAGSRVTLKEFIQKHLSMTDFSQPLMNQSPSTTLQAIA
jgi:hypothetical protein